MGDSTHAPVKRPRSSKICETVGCGREHVAKGLCMSCYDKSRKVNPERQAYRKASRNKPERKERERLTSAVYYENHREEFRARNELYYQNNKDVWYERGVAWAKNNRERKNENERAWHKANPEKRRAWQKANPAKGRESTRRYNERNPEIVAAYKAEYTKKNPLKSREWHHARKARRMGAVISRADFAEILETFGMTCHICSGEIAGMSELHFDHVVPLSRGGAHAPENIRPSHAKCNLRKWANPLQ